MKTKGIGSSLKTGSIIAVDEYRQMKSQKGNKFNNTRTPAETIWGHVTFDSAGEYKCYLNLLPGHEMGDYVMTRQVSYSIEVNGMKICDYRADFVLTFPDGSISVIDFKGVETSEFKLKKKLMKACLGIDIELRK